METAAQAIQDAIDTNQKIIDEFTSPHAHPGLALDEKKEYLEILIENRRALKEALENTLQAAKGSQ